MTADMAQRNAMGRNDGAALRRWVKHLAEAPIVVVLR